MSNDYVSVVYDVQRTPKTDYPSRLVAYLGNRFAIPQGSKLLDVGCGRGDFLEAFQALGMDCHGVDQCESGIEKLRHLKVHRADILSEAVPFPDGTFDVVYHKSVMEHFDSPDRLMRETLRVLKPGGRVIILVPDWVSNMKVFFEDFTHCRPYDVNAVTDVLKMYGFSHIETERFYQLPILWKYPALRIISTILRGTISTPTARRLTKWTGIKFFRWSVELMVLGTGVKVK